MECKRRIWQAWRKIANGGRWCWSLEPEQASHRVIEVGGRALGHKNKTEKSSQPDGLKYTPEVFMRHTVSWKIRFALVASCGAWNGSSSAGMGFGGTWGSWTGRQRYYCLLNISYLMWQDRNLHCWHKLINTAFLKKTIFKIQITQVIQEHMYQMDLFKQH